MTEKRVAIVTGGSRGIGAAIVKRLARDGMHVIAIAQCRQAETVVDEIQSTGGSAEAAACDIADSKALAAAIEKLGEKHGRIDVLVNNAGITKDGLILRMEDEDFDVVMNTNLKSAFVAIRAVGRLMMRSKAGRIINISSVCGVTGNDGQANYAASKAGLIGLSKSVAKELSGKRRDVQRRRPRLHHNRHDRCADRPDQRHRTEDDPAEAFRRSQGNRGVRFVPGIG